MNTRKIIITLCFLVVLTLQRNTKAVAIPDLQLFTPGGSYDGSSETWVFTHTPGSSFTLQVISANEAHPRPGSTGVFVSMALLGLGEFDPLPSGNIINFDGTNFTASNFIWGRPAEPPPGALGKHDIFFAHYVQVLVGSFGTSQTVFDTNEPDNGFPGEARDFSVTINSFIPVHFDAYTLNSNSKIDESAPFSHDAEGAPIPEPATLALLSIGIISLLGYKGRKFLKKA